MTVLLGVLAFFIILAVLILVHEFGHFASAKLLGVRVDEFGLGFPPRIAGWRRGDTLYSINAIPLGGFVKMPGENGECTDPQSFGAKPPWKRLVILAAGPSMNLVLAVTIFFAAFLVGSPRGLTVVTQVEPGSPAAAAGLRADDRIVSVDGKKVRYFDELIGAVDAHLGERLALRYQRGGRDFTVNVVPRLHPPRNQGAIGIKLADSTTIRYSPLHAFRLALQQLGTMVSSMPSLLGTAAQHGGSGLSGPVGIARATTSVVSSEPSLGPGSVLQFVAVLSASLGVLNLLPIPALDGGRIVFVLLSWVRRRNLDPEVEGLIHMIGMACLLMLILYISYQDISSWLSGGSF